MRIGDIVSHKPSGEQWLVAKVCENGDIIAAGWPCTYGRAADCELIEACGDIQHADLIRRLRNLSPEDPRHIRPNPTDHGARSAPVIRGVGQTSQENDHE